MASRNLTGFTKLSNWDIVFMKDIGGMPECVVQINGTDYMGAVLYEALRQAQGDS